MDIMGIGSDHDSLMTAAKIQYDREHNTSRFCMVSSLSGCLTGLEQNFKETGTGDQESGCFPSDCSY